LDTDAVRAIRDALPRERTLIVWRRNGAASTIQDLMGEMLQKWSTEQGARRPVTKRTVWSGLGSMGHQHEQWQKYDR
jgi:hypothetical protein